MIRTFICARTVTGADPRVVVFEDHTWSKITRSPRPQSRPDFYSRCPDHDGLGGGDSPEFQQQARRFARGGEWDFDCPNH